MKKVKIGIWLIIIVFLGLVIYQNRDFFFVKESLGIDLTFAAYHFPELPVALYFTAFFFIGALIVYLFGLADRYHSGKQVKALRQTCDAQRQAIDDLKKDVQALRPQPLSGQTSSPSPVETGVTQEQGIELQVEDANGQHAAKQ